VSISPYITAMLTGAMPDAEAIALLSDLRARGETAHDIAEAADAVMAQALPFNAPADAIDVCGTGGDGLHSLNISTAVAFVASSCGACVVKHSNRAVSSRSGSSDVLAALGIPADLPPSFWEQTAREMGIAFLHAPQFHPGLVRLAPLRKQIGGRTIFNLLGPLCNPARPKRQVMGVYSAPLVPLIAEVLAMRGSEHAWVVHGEDGADEISLSAETFVAELRNGITEPFMLAPEDMGLERVPTDALCGGDAAHNAAAMRRMFAGEKGAYWDTVMVNAAATLVVAGIAATLPEAMERTALALHSGAALQKLEALQLLCEEFVHV